MAVTQSDGDVRAASDRFYEALNRMANGDAGPMSEIWSNSDDVTTMHPIGGREVGWNEVKEPWETIASIGSDGDIKRTDQYLRVIGDLAIELATEHASMSLAGQPVEAEVRATNIYRLEDGAWKIIHHHTDVSDEFVAVLESLEGGE